MVIATTPTNIIEALDFLNEKDAIIMNGGTDLMVKKKSWSGTIPSFDKPILFINSLKELKQVFTEKNNLIIGSGCTFSQLERSPLVPTYLKVVIREIASPAIRNLATIGGNICNASPAGDILTPLYALDAKLRLVSRNKERIIPIKEFIIGPGRTLLNANELLTEIIIENYNNKKFYYHKLGTRRATALAKASFIGFYEVENNLIRDLRIAFGSVGPVIIKDRDLELSLVGGSIKDTKFKICEIVGRYSELIRPINDARSTAKYRKAVCLNLLRNFLLNELSK
ncbi:FAD binding domain-containing protein [Clostridium sp. UBA4548]|uniref:FAD binding domain-containing protein n=1 Tax=Clostridium sp. UBA4548 TaxID=1946361 RepID=UPI0025BC8417|nr:FAD binding domain-containing protein [Clostridium sp. UBA4548]